MMKIHTLFCRRLISSNVAAPHKIESSYIAAPHASMYAKMKPCMQKVPACMQKVDSSKSCFPAVEN